jgi:hypothetical protein
MYQWERKPKHSFCLSPRFNSNTYNIDRHFNPSSAKNAIPGLKPMSMIQSHATPILPALPTKCVLNLHKSSRIHSEAFQYSPSNCPSSAELPPNLGHSQTVRKRLCLGNRKYTLPTTTQESQTMKRPVLTMNSYLGQIHELRLEEKKIQELNLQQETQTSYSPGNTILKSLHYERCQSRGFPFPPS